MKRGMIGIAVWLNALVAGFILVFSAGVFADTPAVFTWNGAGYSSCAALTAAGQAYYGSGYHYTGCGYNGLYVSAIANGGSAPGGNASCPAGSIYDGAYTQTWPNCRSTVTPTPTPAPSCAAGTSLGAYYVPVPGTHVDSTSYYIDDASKVKSFAQGGFTTCVNSCSANGPYSNKTMYGGNSGAAYLSVNLKLNGASCSADPNAVATQTEPGTATPPKVPTGPADCPTNTTFGTINGVNACATNAPLPSKGGSAASAPTGASQLDSGSGQTGSGTGSNPSTSDGCVAGCNSMTGDSGSGGESGSGTVNIPTDYNREVTQKSIDSTNKTILQKITEFFGDGNYDKADHVGDGYAKAAADSASGVAKSITDTGNATTISGYSWEWNVGDYIKPTSCSSGLNIGPWIKIDWCAQVQMVRDFFGFVLYILTAYGLFALFTSKEK